MARANGCDAVGVAWWWALVLTVAVAALASRMLARVTVPAAPVASSARRSEGPAERLADGGGLRGAVEARATGRGGDLALGWLAWLLAIGWATFNGQRPTPWPWWDRRRAWVWAAMLTSAMPGAGGAR